MIVKFIATDSRVIFGGQPHSSGYHSDIARANGISKEAVRGGGPIWPSAGFSEHRMVLDRMMLRRFRCSCQGGGLTNPPTTHRKMCRGFFLQCQCIEVSRIILHHVLEERTWRRRRKHGVSTEAMSDSPTDIACFVELRESHFVRSHHQRIFGGFLFICILKTHI